MKLTILRGISGCGKSTWARQQNAVVVSRDDLRVLLFPDVAVEEYYKSPLIGEREKTVTIMQDAMVAAALKAGRDVIVDNTNIEWKFVKQLAKIGYRYGAEVELKVFDVTLQEAVWRDARRAEAGGRFVGEPVIRKQYERFKSNKNKQLDPVFMPTPYFGTPGAPKAVLVDVDGTIAHMKDYRSPFDWKSVGKDDPDLNVMQIVNWIRLGMYHDNSTVGHLFGEPQARVILMSGRDEVCRQETFDWCVSWDFNYDELFMRPEGDMRPDNIVKAELFDTHIRDHYDVVGVLDDRDQVVDMWRRMGLTCLQVAEGDF